MDKRIFGIETEFGISYSSPDSRPLAPEEVARYLFRKVVSWGRSSNVFLTNGSRLYLDVGSHPEYATAECDDLAQLIAHDRAGELILDDLVDEAQSRLAAEGFNGTVYLFKNNTDSAGNSYGSHENYLIPRRGEFTRLAEILIPFLVSRPQGFLIQNNLQGWSSRINDQASVRPFRPGASIVLQAHPDRPISVRQSIQSV